MNNLFVFGISGPAGAGKSTLAHALSESRSSDLLAQESWFVRISRMSFADPIREYVQKVFDLSHDEMGPKKNEIIPRWGFSARRAMQTLGTEWARSLNEYTWTSYLERRVKKGVKEEPDIKHIVIVDDVRFLNEIRTLQHLTPNFLLIRLERESLEPLGGHQSELLPTISDRALMLDQDQIWHHTNREGDRDTIRQRADELYARYVNPWLLA